MKDQKLYDRLAAKVIKDSNGCWIWQGWWFKDRPHPGNRYGAIGIWDPVKKKSKQVCTHRAIMIAIHGPLTPQQCVCHHCDVPRCINPDHLFIGSMKENIWDSRNKGRHYEASLTHCLRGHPLSGDNLRIDKQSRLRGKTGFSRSCKMCGRAHMRIRAGWPEHLAFNTQALPLGHVMDLATGVSYMPTVGRAKLHKSLRRSHTKQSPLSNANR